ncbi:MAG: AMP-binding protein, partial [Acidimicrobiia bacterium]|nr:AMP-binding protein [Acidimicrobiia bacterium]
MEDELVVWDVFDRIASMDPGRPLVIEPSETATYADVRERSAKFARYLAGQGLGHRRARTEMQGWESGQSHVAMLMGNSSAYLEVLLGCLRARAVPVNVNYRYLADELQRLLSTSQAEAIVYDAEFEDVVAEVVASRGAPAVLVRIGHGTPRVDGAVAYAEILTSADPGPEPDRPIADDLCIVCTGGTTGFPKAVLWRQADLTAMMIGNRHLLTGAPVSTSDDLVVEAARHQHRVLLGPPMMHLSGFGLGLVVAMSGATIVFPGPRTGMDAAAILEAIEQHRAQLLVVVGDAFGRPLLHELTRRRYDTSSLRMVMNGGATMSPSVKAELSAALGDVPVGDGVGSSESGVLARSRGGEEPRPGVFHPASSACIVSEDLSRVLDPSDPAIGWLAGSGRMPLGYLGDPERTASTFPVIDGRRRTVPGDRARWLDDGMIELLGRDATTINTGGEKVYSDEVERVLLRDATVEECLVVGRPSQRWGQEVIALVVPVDAATFVADRVLDTARSVLARYKVPNEVVLVERIERTPVG